jgi:uncharacterized repeat protein (TIGR03803 family)
MMGADMNTISKLHRSRAATLLALATVLVSALATIQSAQAQTFTTLYSFCTESNCKDGQAPASMVQATNGDLYGVTTQGGEHDGGTMFKLPPGGALTRISSFALDSYPTGLIQATNGNFYGTTAGTVFKINANGKLTTLTTLAAGAYGPIGTLVQATNSDFYGVTQFTEDTYCGCGTVYKVTPGGTLTTLYQFLDEETGNVGSRPGAPLIQATNGDLYGTTIEGGGVPNGGTVFKITPGGTLTYLNGFCSIKNSANVCLDGDSPASLMQASDGNFYGTTSYGGTGNYSGGGAGTVFRITPKGKLTTLYSFCSQPACTDGVQPSGGLIQATDGNFYGVTTAGGSNLVCGGDANEGCGTVFSITPGGVLTTLYNFCSQSNCADGGAPTYGLTQATNGLFYGTTEVGGANNLLGTATLYGTVFSLSTGLGPFVILQTSIGKVGAAVTILGTDLTGSTSVTFNGTTAVFTVVSASEITTTVPNGATTGIVQVVTPGGTLNSNVAYTVK